MSERILLVDDEENVLQAYTRTLRRRFELSTALGGQAALEAVERDGPFAVIVADMRMPGIDGVQLLARMKDEHPDTVRLMLTGNADQGTAQEAVNQGEVFRFLTKPCEPDVLAMALEAALEHHRRILGERALLEQTVQGAVRMLIDLLALLAPASLSRAQRTAELSVQVAQDLGMGDHWQVGVAAFLAQIGSLTLPHGLLARAQSGAHLEAEDLAALARVPATSAQLIRNVPRLEPVAEIVAHAKDWLVPAEPVEGTLAGEDLPLGSRILHAVADYLSRPQEGFQAPPLVQMRMEAGRFDPRVLEALEGRVEATAAAQKGQEQRLLVNELRPGMTLVRDVATTDGWLVAPEGTLLAPHHLERIRNFHRLNGVLEPVTVTT